MLGLSGTTVGRNCQLLLSLDGGSALIRSVQPILCYSQQQRFYFTNGDRVKKEDPYATLGLQWGDGASTATIKTAFLQKARELHPDVNQTDSPDQALQKFQALQRAYETLMKSSTANAGSLDRQDMEEWQIHIWRQGDRIACDRTDVAGVLKKRPARPAVTGDPTWALRGQLGHPNGHGVTATRRGEYLGEVGTKRASSVGRGQSKWVTPKEFKPWNPSSADEKETKRASSAVSSTESHRQKPEP